MADMYSDNSTRSAILAASVAQFSYFQADEPSDMAEEELWYNPDDLIIRRFIDGVWIPRGTYIPVDQQRCIVIKRAVIDGLTVAGPVYILREGNAFSSAPIYDGGLDPAEIMRLVDAAYISIKDRTINSEEYVPLTTHDGTETHIVLKPAFDWRVGGTLPQELVQRICAAGDDGVTLILTQVDLSDPTVPHDMIMITSYVANNGYFVYTITVFDQDNGPVATFGINSADGSVISEVSVTLTSFDVTAVVPNFTAINYVYAYSDDAYSETLDDAHTAAAELLLHAVAVHETETINADMLDRYLPTVINKDDAKRHLVKNPGSDPSWDEYRHINGVWKYDGSLTSHNTFQIYRESITLISGDKENPDVGDIVLMYDDFYNLCYGVASIIRVWGQSLDIVIIGRNLIPFDYGITYTDDNHLTIDTDRITTKIVDGKLKAIGQLTYNPESGDPISGIGVADAVGGMIKDVYYSHADGSKTSLLDGNAGADLAPIAGLRKVQGNGNNTSITDATDDHLAAKSYVDEIKAKIPSAATADNQLADKDYVNETVRDMAAEFRGAFATYADLLAYSGEMSKLDYAIVLSDETRDGATTRYSYSGSAWLFQYIVNNTPFTQNQIDAINSGANADNIGTIDVHTEQIHTINSYLARQDRRLDDDERDIDALQEEVVELQNYPQTVYADSMDADDADNGMMPKNYFCLTWTNFPDGAKSATGFIQYVPAVVKQGLDTLTLGLQSYISFNEASIWQRMKDDSGEWGAWEQVGDVSGKVDVLSDGTTYTPDGSGGYTEITLQGSVRNSDGSVELQSAVMTTPQGGSTTTHFAYLSLYGADVILIPNQNIDNIQCHPVMLLTVALVSVQMVSQSLSTTSFRELKTSLRNPRLRISFQIGSIGFISGVAGGRNKRRMLLGT